MITRRGNKTGRTMRGSKTELSRFSVVMTSREELISSASSTTETINDAVVDTYTSATIDRMADASVVKNPLIEEELSVLYRSTDDDVAVVDKDTGVMTRVSDGYVHVIATDSSGHVSASPVVAVERDVTVTYVFDSWADGSLAKHVADAIDAAISGRDTSHMPMFSSYTYGVGGTRNANNWAALAGWDLSCIAVNKPNSLLIASDAVLQAEHYPYTGTVAFVAMDGTEYTREIDSWQNIGPANSADAYETDLRVVRLESALPSDIQPALLPPANLTDYLPSPHYGFPLITSDQEKKTHVADSSSLTAAWLACGYPTDAQRLALFETKITGDSGCNAFLPPLSGDDQLIAVALWTYGGAGSGPCFAGNLTEIQSAITSLGCSGSVTVADLSSFTSY